MPHASSLSRIGTTALAPHPLPDDRAALRDYLARVRSIEPLTADDEAELFRRYRDGDDEAGEQLVLANLRTVLKVAMRYHSELASTLDLVQEGNVGLLRALQRFDPTRGVPFSAFARYWIRAMILRFVMENHRLVKLGGTRDSRRLFFELARERARLIQRGEEATAPALAERLGIDVAEVRAVTGTMTPEESLDGPRDGLGWHEVLPAPSADPEADAARGTLHDALGDALEAFEASLDGARDRELLHARLLSEDPVSLAELGRRHGVTRERMRQLEQRLKRRLRAYLLDTFGDDIEVAAA